MFPLKLQRSSPLARGDSAYRGVAGSLFSPRRAGPLTLPVKLVSVCCHTWFELLRKIHPSSLSGVGLRSNGTMEPISEGQEKKSLCLSVCSHCRFIFEKKETLLKKIIPYEMFSISSVELLSMSCPYKIWSEVGTGHLIQTRPMDFLSVLHQAVCN